MLGTPYGFFIGSGKRSRLEVAALMGSAGPSRLSKSQGGGSVAQQLYAQPFIAQSPPIVHSAPIDHSAGGSCTTRQDASDSLPSQPQKGVDNDCYADEDEPSNAVSFTLKLLHRSEL